MNVFQLGMIFAPLVGLLAGGAAVASRSPGDLALGAIAGLIIGAASYFVPVLLSAKLFAWVTGPQGPSERPSVIEWCMGLLVVLCAGCAPYLAGALSWWAVKAVLAVFA